MHLRLKLATVLLFATASIATLRAQTIHVPADQPTIQAGIDAAHTGDTVLVAPGTYYENIDFKGKAITVTSSGGAAQTIIDGGGKNPTVSFQSGEKRSAVLSNLTVQDGTSGNQSNSNYAGIYINNAAPTLLNNVITQNECWDIASYDSAPLIQGNEISSANPGGQGCGFGGGAGIIISGDQSSSYPSATDGISPIIVGNTIENNTHSGLADAGGNGGAAVAVWGGAPLIEDNIMRNNSSPGGSGGAINVVYGTATIVQNLIYDNQAACGGGAISWSAGGGIGGTDYILIANNTIVDNTGAANAGFSECINISQIYPAADTYGTSGPTAVIVNNIISGSTNFPAVNCSWFSTPNEGVQPTFDHNILFNASGPFFGSYCIDVSAKYQNIAANPQFVNQAAHDYHLLATSPGIDHGNNSVIQALLDFSKTALTTDFDSKPRIADVTGTGYPVIDIGAYESAGPVSPEAPTSVVLSSNAYTGSAGSNYKLTASLSSAAGVPTGPVTFFIDGNNIGTANTTAGVALLSNVAFTPGIHALLATYPGQGQFAPAISIVIFVSIDRYTTTLTLTGTPNPSQLGQSVAFTVHVASADSGFIPAPITLTDNYASTPLTTLTPDSTGTATYSISTLTKGSHTITASYAGDTAHNSATAYVSQTVNDPNDTTTTLVSSLNPSILGQPVTFTASVKSFGGNAPAGSIQFTSGATVLGTIALTSASSTGISTAALTTSTLPLGSSYIVATFVPSSPFNASASYQLYQQVISGYPTTISLTSSLNPSTINDTVTFTAHIASANGTPTGSVAFTEGAVQLAFRPLDSTGLATFPTSALPSGQHIITATYVPTGAFAPAATILTQTVNGYDTTSTLAPLPSSINAGTTLTFSAKVAPKLSTSPGAPSGVVTFLLDGSSIGSVPMNVTTGTATLTSPTLTSGLHTLTCYYEGDLTFNPSTCAPLSFTASTLPTTLTLASPASPIYALNTIPFVANLTSTGTPVANAPITITLGSTGISSIGCSGTTNTAGTLACSTNTPNFLPGTQAFSAIYNGDNTHAAARTPSTITIVPNPTTPSVTTSASTAPQGGDLAITLHATTATTAFTPDGTLTLLDGITPIGSVTLPATTSGTGTIAATLHITTLSVGSHTLSVAYQPSTSSFIANAAAGSVTVTITPSSFTLSSDPAALSIQTQHHASVTLNLASIGAFANTVDLSCNTPLPPVLKCEFARTQVALTAGGTASTTLKLETDAVDNFYAANTTHSPRAQRSREVPALCGCFFAMLFALPLATRRRRKAITLSLAALAILSLASITGCSGQYPDHTPPGTYDILVTGTGNNITKTTHLTLTITP